MAPFIGPMLMRVGGRGHAAAPDCAASRGVGPWRAEDVYMCYVPGPAISQKLSLGSRGEQLDVEELIPETDVERLGKAVLPWRSGFDMGRTGGGSGLALVA